MFQRVPQTGFFYILLELAESDLGQYLKTLAKEDKPLPLHEIVDLFIQMVQSVENCHKKGVLHFDLKPANFLRCNGQIKLSDFGLAGMLNEGTKSFAGTESDERTHVSRNGLAGTTKYMAPEMIHQTGQAGYLLFRR